MSLAGEMRFDSVGVSDGIRLAPRNSPISSSIVAIRPSHIQPLPHPENAGLTGDGHGERMLSAEPTCIIAYSPMRRISSAGISSSKVVTTPACCPIAHTNMDATSAGQARQTKPQASGDSPESP